MVDAERLGEVLHAGTIGGGLNAQDKALRNLVSQGHHPHVVYGAGSCGCAICRHPATRSIACDVFAPSSTPNARATAVQLIAAVTLVAELQDFLRFDTPRQLMAYVGLVPAEHSSGPKRRQGSITKAGNSAARRMLVEVAWHYQHSPRVSPIIAARHDDLPKEVPTAQTHSDAGGGTRRSRGHWGTLDNVIEHRPRGNSGPLISDP